MKNKKKSGSGFQLGTLLALIVMCVVLAIANRNFYSPTNIMGILKKTTFNAFLTRCRMEAAMKLLREKPDLLLRDVAACVGYDDSSYFTKVFHQYTGKTPSQFTSGS